MKWNEIKLNEWNKIEWIKWNEIKLNELNEMK